MGQRHRLDDLRRSFAALGVAVGLPPARASAWASHGLWFETASLPRFGLARLIDELGRIERGEIDPRAEAAVTAEHAATVDLDGRLGVPGLVLSRAAGLAGEKARDVGVGLVQVTRVGPAGSAAATVAELATGPEVGLALGPGASWSLALPSADGLPVVLDSTLIDGALPPAVAELARPWSLLAPEDGWLIAALSVKVVGPLAVLQQRVAGALQAESEPLPGLLAPRPWEDRRRAAREDGLSLDAATEEALRNWAVKLRADAPGRPEA